MRRRQAELEQYETDLEWVMGLKEQTSVERKILEAREDLFQYERELKTPRMTPLQRLREDVARYQEELEWAIDPWKRSFWEEKLTEARADLARYGWDLEPMEMQKDVNDHGEEGERQDPEGDAESDLGDAMRRVGKSILTGEKVVRFGDLPRNHRMAFQDGLATAVPEVKTLLEREYLEADYTISPEKKSRYYQRIHVVQLGSNAEPSTLAHELFHRLDNKANISTRFHRVLRHDYIALKVASGGDIKGYLMRKYPEAFSDLSKSGKPVMGEAYRGLADILNGLSGGTEYYGFGHRPGYWADKGALEAEAWAQFGRVLYTNQKKVLRMFQDIFPNFWHSAIIALKEVL